MKKELLIDIIAKDRASKTVKQVQKEITKMQSASKGGANNILGFSDKGLTDSFNKFANAANRIKSINEDMSKSFRGMQGATEFMNGMDNAAAKMAPIGRMQGPIKMTTKELAMMNIEGSRIGRWAQKGKEELIGFNGAALSTLFFGMYIQQVFTGALTSIFEGYKKIIPESHEFNKATTQLSANWEFFKFQLADAMAQSPLFQNMIKWLINVIQTFQKLPESVKVGIVAFMALAAVFGALMFMTSNIKLGIAGIIDTMGKAKIAAAGFTWGGFAKFGVVLLAAAAVLGLKAAYDKFADSSDYAREKTDKLKDSFVQTFKSGLDPLLEAFNVTGLELNNWNEMMIWLGAVIHNTINGLGAMIDTVIFLARVITNFVSATLSPFIGGLETAAKTLVKLFDGDYEGAWDAAKDYFTNVKDNFVEDIDDMVDAWNNLGDSLQTRMDASVSPSMAVDEYRREMAMQEYNDARAEIDARNKPTVINNIITPEMAQIESEVPGLREAREYIAGGGI